MHRVTCTEFGTHSSKGIVMQFEPHIATPSGGARQRIMATPAQLAPRNVEVWLPPGYDRPGQRLPVIYMHDGQNIFDPVAAYGGHSWEVDRALKVLIAAEGMLGAIGVGVWNSGQRWQEYAPQKPFEAFFGTPEAAEFLARAGGSPVSDAYLAFLVSELKPLIDANYPTLPDQANNVNPTGVRPENGWYVEMGNWHDLVYSLIRPK